MDAGHLEETSGHATGADGMTLEREWMRGAAPLAVLTLLERREMYGYELVEALERDTGGILAMGQSTVYPLLYNLEGRGKWGCGQYGSGAALNLSSRALHRTPPSRLSASFRPG